MRESRFLNRSTFLLAMLAPACATEIEPQPSVGVVEAAQLGGFYFENHDSDFPTAMCNTEQRYAARQIGTLGRTIASSQAMYDCVDRTMRSGTTLNGYPAGPYHASSRDVTWGQTMDQAVAQVQSLMRTPDSVGITCLVGSGLPDGASGVGQTYERIGLRGSNLTLAYDNLTDPDIPYTPTTAEPDLYKLNYLSTVTGTLWHETMHANGFDHASGPYLGSVPMIVQHCMKEIIRKSVRVCRRDLCSAKPAYLPVIRNFTAWANDPNASLDCQCVRDSSTTTIGVGNSVPGDARPAPKLGTPEYKDLLGYATAVGDFNGDGFDDLAVGAPGTNSSRGTVFLYEGSIFGLQPSKELPPPGPMQQGDRYGYALAAGDFNDDGLDDLAIGMPQHAGNGAGRVYVWNGSTQASLTPVANYGQSGLGSDEDGDSFGFALAVADFDYDGVQDLAVGAPDEVFGSSTKSGRVYLLRGQRVSAGLSPLSMWKTASQSAVETNETGDRFGAVLAAGWLKGVRYGSQGLLVGAPGEDGYKGRVFVFESDPPADNVTDWPATRSLQPANIAAGARFGNSLAIGSFHHNGGDMIAAGAPESGNVYIYKGASLRQTLDYGRYTGRKFGASLAVARAGGDAQDELLVGDATPGQQSTVTIMIGGASLTIGSSIVPTLMGTVGVDDLYGFSLAVGDFDNEAAYDLAIGAPTRPRGDVVGAGTVFTYRNNGSGSLMPMSALFEGG